jgi:hypothetical protein
MASLSDFGFGERALTRKQRARSDGMVNILRKELN